MSYQVLIDAAARRQIRKLPLSVQELLLARITALGKEPRPSGCKKLKGRKDEYRIRAGNYRVIYNVQDTLLIVRVIRAGHRKDAYD